MDKISENTRQLLKTINQVAGFNPGELMVPLDDGELFLGHQSRLNWFWLKYPNGKIDTRTVSETDTKVVSECFVYANRHDPESAYIANDIGECRGDEETDLTPLAMSRYRARTAALGVACFNSYMADAYLTGNTPVTDSKECKGAVLPGTPADPAPPKKRGGKGKGAINTAQPAASLAEEAQAAEQDTTPEGEAGPFDPDQVTMDDVGSSAETGQDTPSGNDERTLEPPADASDGPASAGEEPGEQISDIENLPNDTLDAESHKDAAVDAEPNASSATGDGKQDTDSSGQKKSEKQPDMPAPPTKADKTAGKPGKADAKKNSPGAAPVTGWTMAAPGENDGQFVEPLSED